MCRRCVGYQTDINCSVANGAIGNRNRCNCGKESGIHARAILIALCEASREAIKRRVLDKSHARHAFRINGIEWRGRIMTEISLLLLEQTMRLQSYYNRSSEVRSRVLRREVIALLDLYAIHDRLRHIS